MYCLYTTFFFLNSFVFVGWEGMQCLRRYLFRGRGVVLEELPSILRRFASTWILNDHSFSSAKKLADDFIYKQTTGNAQLQGVDVSHRWEKDTSCPNSHLLTFTVQKGGTSTIQFKVKEHSDPPSVSITEHDRSLAFFHSAFAGALDSQINGVITSLGAKPK